MKPAKAKKAATKKGPASRSAATKKTAATIRAATKKGAATKKRAEEEEGATPGRASVEPEIAAFADARAWTTWLAEHHASSPGVWLKLAKKSSAIASITYAEAVEGALAWGWIDGQKQAHDATWWLQRFTPRRARSIWSKINRDKAMALIEAGAMAPPGLLEVERARADGRWEAAYDPPSRAAVPEDLAAALAANPRAAAFFAALDGTNRYAVLFRIHGAKKAETRAGRVTRFVEMLARHEKLYP